MDNIKDLPGWKIDPNTRMVINTNDGELARVKAARERHKKELALQKEVVVLKAQVQQLHERLEALEKKNP